MNPAKYDRNTQGKGDYWKQRTMASAGNYCKGIAEALGISEAQCASSGPGRDYQAGINAATGADYNAGVNGKGQKWFNNYRAKFTS
jgi:hypothetical protein